MSYYMAGGMTNSVMGAGLLDIKPSPDWKGPICVSIMRVFMIKNIIKLLVEI